MRIQALSFILFFMIGLMSAQVDYVNNTEAVLELLKAEKEKHRNYLSDSSSNHFNTLKHLQDIGDWDFVLEHIEGTKSLEAVEKAVLIARNAWFQNDFSKAEKLLMDFSDKESTEVARLWATLAIEAWDLEKAENITKEILQKNTKDIETEIILGRTWILQKKYEEALALAEARIKESPENATGYFMKADVFFWSQEPEKAEKALKQGLEINPLHADARFFYGYAIWRRIDATQLDAMMAQWELALELNPLHFQTHWHIGNGHTNLTFADYADSKEEEIRSKLAKADALFTNGNKSQALAEVKNIASAYPTSVLPDMHYASLLYSDFDTEDRVSNLAKAAQIFIDILKQKKHYGPAHNGLSAVIKSQRIPYLRHYEETKKALLNADIANIEDMLELFPDVAYYPGDIAKGMVWNQLYTSVAYFPFLVAQDRSYVIPPLHEDLALAMNNSYFRYNTTFDNRQWMDIRGVGSGAASIEYTERGAFGERNVLLHEFVHLFHSVVTTDEQNRAIRALYYNAMENGLTLDYYSQNNESEYFAQTYPAYFEEVKVHPLDFKSMNTTADLKKKDPKMYAFLDRLVSKEKAYLNGDQEAMASNWAQVYVNKAKKDPKKAYSYLQTALEYDKEYLPAYLAFAEQLLKDKRWEDAYAKLEEAKNIQPNYAPIYMVEAQWLATTKPEAIKAQAALYKKAYDMETDYMEKAANARTLRTFYYHQAMLPEALNIAEEYVKNATAISTYLRDSKEATEAFSAWQRALLGEENQLETLKYLVSQRPHNYSMRLQYAEALIALHYHEEAIALLLPTYKNLQASKIDRPDFELLLAEAYEGIGNKMEMQKYIQKLLEKEVEKAPLDALISLRLADLLIRNDNVKKALLYTIELTSNTNPLTQAALYFTNAQLALSEGKTRKALTDLEASLKANPYHLEAINTLENLGKKHSKAKKLWRKYKGNRSI